LIKCHKDQSLLNRFELKLKAHKESLFYAFNIYFTFYLIKVEEV
jgi:hypothetical protein